MSDPAAINVEVVMAWPRRYESVMLTLQRGSTVADAVAAAGLDGLEAVSGYAVYGVKAQPGALLAHGDRVELLRPLQMEPKEARRRRAEKKQRP